MIFFGTDGIRGEAYKSLPLIRSYQLGYALNEIFKERKVVIGYDTRESSLDFLNALLQGLGKKNIEVAGVVTTPMIALHSKLESCLGVMITASHNPYYDNGLKVFLNGEKISNDLIKKIESIMLKVKEFVSEKVQFEIYNDTKRHYLDFIEKLNLKMTFDDYVIDTANGSAYNISKNLFNGKIYFDKPNGRNINKDCGCTSISTINQINTKKKVSFSFDGDGDRVLMTINKKVIYGDQITYIIVRDMIERGNFPNIALSIMTNQGVIKAFKKMNIRIVEVDVGDINILKEIKKKNVELGSEPSGHIILNYGSNIYLGDGVLIARKIIDIISRKGIKKVISWLAEISLIPIKTVNFKISKKILEDANVKKCLNEIIDKKQENEKIVVRPSGTQNLIRVTVSSEAIKNQETIIQNIEKCLTGETL